MALFQVNSRLFGILVKNNHQYERKILVVFGTELPYSPQRKSVFSLVFCISSARGLVKEMSENANVFVAVVESGGFSAAAKKLHLTPSAVSKHVSRLEDRLSVQLLIRTTRHVELTDAGEHYYRNAKELLESFRDVEQKLSTYQTHSTGILRIAASPSLGATGLIEALKIFSEEFPDLNYELKLSSESINLVEKKIHLAIREGELGDSQLRAKKLFDSKIVMCANPAYLQRYGQPRNLDDLELHNFILLDDYRLKSWLRRAKNKISLKSINTRLLVDDLHGVYSALRAEMGIGLAPYYLVKDDLRSGHLQEINLNLKIPSVPINAVYPSERYMAKKTRNLLDFLVDYFR